MPATAVLELARTRARHAKLSEFDSTLNKQYNPELALRIEKKLQWLLEHIERLEERIRKEEHKEMLKKGQGYKEPEKTEKNKRVENRKVDQSNNIEENIDA